MIDSQVKKRLEVSKEDNIVASNLERKNSHKENSLGGKNKGKGIINANESKQTEAPETVTSPWITTRSFHQKTSTSQTLAFAKETSNIPATSKRRNKFSRAQDAPVTHSVQLFAQQTSVLRSGDSKQKKFDGLTYRRKGSGDGNSQRAEEFRFVTAQEVLVNKALTEDNREDRTQTLRMKLCEILGTVSSPRSQPSNSQPREAETDSENPDHTTKRPVTCYMTRKRISTKVQAVKTKVGPSSSYRNKIQEKNIFSFGEGLFGKGDVAVSSGSTIPMRKNGRIKISGIEPRRINFNENNNKDEIQAAAHWSKIPSDAETEKASPLGDKTGNSHGCLPQGKEQHLEQKNINQERDSHQSPRKESRQSLGTNRVDLQGDYSSPAAQENGDEKGEFFIPSLKNIMETQVEFQSPTFKLNTPILSSSPISAPKTDKIERTIYSPAPAEGRFTLGNIRSFRTLQTSNADCHSPNAKTESSDDALELKDSPRHKPSPLTGRKEAEGLSESSSDDGDSKSLEEERDVLSPEVATAERSTFMLYRSKRLRNHEGNDVPEFGPTSASPKGTTLTCTGDSDWNPEPSEQYQENELERVIKLFVLALENFKDKMKSVTRKKSCEILMSVSEDIQLQLQNIESQIQTDVGKLTSASKSKRKRLETRLQEQQEKLKLIHDKFKEDIYQLLHDCKSTVEELEMHHNELKGTVKKQKAMHQKLFVNMEEAVETQLSDAHRRITAMHKSARDKMLQLQHVIAKCLNEDWVDVIQSGLT
uniref:Meiosis-specific protein ASY3-like coiled-coil domain-containing protein n=1 Tax=Manihot esculenta TaxID=3983 RepID=A0A2C9VS59_MANES